MSTGPQMTRVRLLRRDGADIRIGQFIAYIFEGVPFGVFASRYGIEIKGEFPLSRPDTINKVKEVLDRAIIHHQHLATFPVGDPQYILSEEEVESRMNLPEAIEEVAQQQDTARLFNVPRIVPITGGREQ